MTRRRANRSARLLFCAALVGVLGSSAWASVGLGWGYVEQSVGGFIPDLTPPTSFEALDVVNIGLFALRDGAAPYTFNALEVIIQWDSSKLELLGVDDFGGVANDYFFTSDFMNDAWDINEAFPPLDGDGIYTGWGITDIEAPAGGLLVTTFQFKALEHLDPLETEVAMIASLKGGVTRVDWGFQSMLGSLGAPIPVAYLPEPTVGLALLAGAVVLLGTSRRRAN